MHVSKTTICKKQTIENTDHRFYARKQPNSWTSMTTTFGAMAGLANAKNRVLYVALAEQTGRQRTDRKLRRLNSTKHWKCSQSELSGRCQTGSSWRIKIGIWLYFTDSCFTDSCFTDSRTWGALEIYKHWPPSGATANEEVLGTYSCW